MALQLDRRLFTLGEYERMVEAGVFGEDERLELIRGEIIEMAPIGFPHEMCVARLTKLLSKLTGDDVLVWPQNNSIRLPNNSRPEPDLTLLRWRADYSANKPPTPQDVLLLIEVADTSLAYDRGVKGPLYAEAGIPEYWIVNLREQIIEIYSDPSGGTYRRTQRAGSGDSVPLPTTVGGMTQVDDILGLTK